MRRALTLLLSSAMVLVSACSVQADDQATAVAPGDLPPDLQPVETVQANSSTTVPPVGTEVPIYLVNTVDQLLEAVPRTVREPTADVEDALRELLQVPSEEEREGNLISQLVTDPDPDDPDAEPGQLELLDTQVGPNQINIQIRGEISAEGAARNQAFAQIVFTASEPGLPGARPRVLIQNASGRNRAVTTDEGLVDDRPVSRDDYPSLDPDTAQEPAGTTTSRPAPSTRAPTTTGPPDTRNRTLTVPPITIPSTTTGADTLPRQN